MSFVYFIQRADGEGPVRIGYSHAPASRLQALMHWSPYPLAIRAQVKCADERSARKVERGFHERHLGCRLHSEWHEPAPLLLADMAAINAEAFDFAHLPRPTVATINRGNCGPQLSAMRDALRKSAWDAAHGHEAA